MSIQLVLEWLGFWQFTEELIVSEQPGHHPSFTSPDAEKLLLHFDYLNPQERLAELTRLLQNGELKIRSPLRDYLVYSPVLSPLDGWIVYCPGCEAITPALQFQEHVDNWHADSFYVKQVSERSKNLENLIHAARIDLRWHERANRELPLQTLLQWGTQAYLSVVLASLASAVGRRWNAIREQVWSRFDRELMPGLRYLLAFCSVEKYPLLPELLNACEQGIDERSRLSREINEHDLGLAAVTLDYMEETGCIGNLPMSPTLSGKSLWQLYGEIRKATLDYITRAQKILELAQTRWDHMRMFLAKH
jgi:hypothetical protein